MILIESLMTAGFEPALYGMRNPHESWHKSDSHEDKIGDADKKLALDLINGGSVHCKFRRQIVTWANITAPLYWWKQFDTYRSGVEKDSCSTMHTIHKRELGISDFSTDQMHMDGFFAMEDMIDHINEARKRYLVEDDKDKREMMWYTMIQLLPDSYNQKRTVMLSYEAMANMYEWRRNHKLDEWKEFCEWIESLPHSWIITGNREAIK